MGEQSKYYLIIAGSRSITSEKVFLDLLSKSPLWKQLNPTPQNTVIVCGMARGVDTLSYNYFKKLGFEILECPADWDNLDTPGAVIKTNPFGKRYNAKAGIDRNIYMAHKSDGLIAMWSGKTPGTKQMIDCAKKLGLEVDVLLTP